MSALYRLPGTHRLLTLLICDYCGFKVTFDVPGRSAMLAHLLGEHPATREAK